MTTFSRWLESMGQDPRSFRKDALIFALRFFVAVFIVLLPLSLLARGLLLILPTPSPVPVVPGAKPVPPPGFWLLMVPFGLYLFFAIVAMLAYLGGWRKLAAKFPAPQNFAQGQLFRWQSGGVGVCGYNNILTVRVSPQGLYLACTFPFRFMHPPLLIPWSQIKSLREQRILGRTSFYLLVGAPKIATVTFQNPKIIAAARQWLPGS